GRPGRLPPEAANRQHDRRQRLQAGAVDRRDQGGGRRLWLGQPAVAKAALRRTIEGGMLHSISRALHEEVQFDTEKVTSVDWTSHPSLTHLDVPEKIDVVLVNGDPNPARPDLPHYGAGETTCKPMIAAIANAIFDATGV